MPIRLTISAGGEVHGHIGPRHLLRAAWVDIFVDGDRVARVRTRASSSKGGRLYEPSAYFTFQLPPNSLDGRLHEVRARLRGTWPLASSAAPFEHRRKDAPSTAFVLEPASGGEAPAPPGFVAAHGRAAVLFDSRCKAAVFDAPERSMLQNRIDIGGLAEHRAYRTWAPYIAAFRDYYVDPGHGGVYRPEGGEVWQGSTYLFNTSSQERTSLQVLSGKLAQAPARRCILFCNSVRDTYFHWHLDCLTGLLMTRARLGREATAIGPPLNSWQKASLKLLGEEVVELEAACRPEEVYVASHIDGRGIYPDHAVLRLFARLKAGRAAQRRGPHLTASGARVFISRRDAPHRVLENEEELWAALKPKGFVRFVPGDASYGEQIDLFSNAETIVASHGSALTNMGFCRPKTTVVEILPADYVNGCFRYLAIAARLRHAWYATEQTDPFAVDVGGFMGWCAGKDFF